MQQGRETPSPGGQPERELRANRWSMENGPAPAVNKNKSDNSIA